MSSPEIESTFWVETFEKRALTIRVGRRMSATSEESAMAAMRVAAAIEVGASVLRIDRSLRTGQPVALEVVKVMGRTPARYRPELPGTPPAQRYKR